MKYFTLRIDDKMLKKLKFIAQSEGRSANSQISVLISKCIEKFEKEQGKTKTDL